VQINRIRRLYILGTAGWTLLLLLLFAWSVFFTTTTTTDLALIEARALFNKDKATRFWASDHGGVYVPITEKTPPNPFLAHVPDRDITLASGTKLTLMNPAYMLRQMMSDYEKLYGVRGHITSEIHYRPETAPDSWEVKSLRKFEAGVREVVEISDIDGQPFLRLMQPLFVNQSCLKCHGIQGYKVGDLRGGVSLSVPLAKYYAVQKKSLLAQGIAFGLAWLGGLLLIALIRSRFTQCAPCKNENA
jgi:hypothetical protein